METINALSIAYSLSVFGIEAEIDNADTTPTIADSLSVFGIDLDTPAPVAPAPAPAKPLAQMTVKELRNLAKGQIKGFMKLSKAQLIAALQPIVEPQQPARKGGRKRKVRKAA